MKVVILAGGFGSRISEESNLRPKPMIEIGHHPILWHIMKLYSAYGFYDFIICCGYKGAIIKEYFSNYYLHNSDVTFDFADDNIMTVHTHVNEPWHVTLVDTGLETMTGGRIKRIRAYLSDDEAFMLTYGDGVADVNIKKLCGFHLSHGKLATVTVVRPEGRFGITDLAGDQVIGVREKSDLDVGWINGGFMVLEPQVLDYIEADHTVWEKEPLVSLAADNQLMAYKHYGFWQCMDTQRDKVKLEELWNTPQPPWRVWE